MQDRVPLCFGAAGSARFPSHAKIISNSAFSITISAVLTFLLANVPFTLIYHQYFKTGSYLGSWEGSDAHDGALARKSSALIRLPRGDPG